MHLVVSAMEIHIKTVTAAATDEDENLQQGPAEPQIPHIQIENTDYRYWLTITTNYR